MILSAAASHLAGVDFDAQGLAQADLDGADDPAHIERHDVLLDVLAEPVLKASGSSES